MQINEENSLSIEVKLNLTNNEWHFLLTEKDIGNYPDLEQYGFESFFLIYKENAEKNLIKLIKHEDE